MGAKHLGCYGADQPTSPNLDALASQGVLFEEAIAAAPWTLPSHASLLTGLYPSRHGARTMEQSLSEGVTTLAGVLSEHGFETAGFVNAIFMAGSFGFARGFDEYERLPTVHEASGAARDVTARALRWLGPPRDRRVFLFLHYFDAHSDYRSQPRFERLLGASRERVNGTTEELLPVARGKRSLEPAEVEDLERLYRAGIRQLDAEIGVLLARLEEQGWLDRALVVVTSDHGEEFMEHGRVLHTRSHYDELLRVPLILRGPGVPSGRRIATPVSLVDVAPTVADLLGVPFPRDVDGMSLRKLWQAPDAAPAARALFTETGPTFREETQWSVREGRFKLVTDLATDQLALYDLREDPGETRDVAAAHPDVVRRLRAAVLARASSTRGGSAAPTLSPGTEEQLRQLGYH